MKKKIILIFLIRLLLNQSYKVNSELKQIEDKKRTIREIDIENYDVIPEIIISTEDKEHNQSFSKNTLGNKVDLNEDVIIKNSKKCGLACGFCCSCFIILFLLIYSILKFD